MKPKKNRLQILDGNGFFSYPKFKGGILVDSRQHMLKPGGQNIVNLFILVYKHCLRVIYLKI